MIAEKKPQAELDPKALKVAEGIIRDLCFTNYTNTDVRRVARRLMKAYHDGQTEDRK